MSTRPAGHDPYETYDPPPQPGPVTQTWPGDAVGSHFVSLPPPVEAWKVKFRLAVVRMAQGDVTYRVGPRATSVLIFAPDGATVSIALIDVDGCGCRSVPGDFTTIALSTRGAGGAGSISTWDGVPPDSFGEDGQMCLNMQTYDVLEKVGGTWA